MSRQDAPTTLLLIRHARTVWNGEQRYAGHEEVALAAESEKQIATLTRKLIQEPISAIYSSPLSRCLLTVTPTAEILSIPIGIDRRLQERNLGAWEGRRAAELELEYPGFHFPEGAYSGQFSIPGAETLAEVTYRTEQVLSSIAALHPGETVLLATHAGIIWAAENIALHSGTQERVWPENSTETKLLWQAGSFIQA